jgi:glycosidase
MDRFFIRINKDFENWKIAMVLYATMRGIPQFYYGTELLFANEKLGNDGQRRSDFYGGWENDTKDALTKKGLTEKELAAQQFFSQLLNWRKSSRVIHNGKFKHYAPSQNDVYVYFRYNEKESVMIIMNNSVEKQKMNINHFKESIKNNTSGKDVLTDKSFDLKNDIEIEGKSVLILELK